MFSRILELRDLNAKLSQWESYYQAEIPESLPMYVQLPTGTKCNLKCSFCTDREGDSAKYYKNLSFEEFVLLGGPLCLASLVQLYGWGEPFINNEYEKIFNYVTKSYPGIQVYISTNGILLDNRWIDKIVSYGNAIINVSLNASTPETYSKVMMADKFNEVLNNIENFNQARKELKGVSLLLSFVPVQQNIHELPDFINLASRLHANVMVQDLNIMEERHKKLSLALDPKPERMGSIFNSAQREANDKKVLVNIFGSTSLNPDNDQSCYPSSLHPMNGLCYEPWQRMMVGIDGNVTPCCFSGMQLGNMYKQNWLDIWRGEGYRNLRRSVNSINPPADCLRCPARMGR